MDQNQQTGSKKSGNGGPAGTGRCSYGWMNLDWSGAECGGAAQGQVIGVGLGVIESGRWVRSTRNPGMGR